MRRVVWYKLTDVSVVVTASNIREIIALMMEVVSTSETSVSITRLYGATSQKTVIFLEGCDRGLL
jgi:hypothetical protein